MRTKVNTENIVKSVIKSDIKYLKKSNLDFLKQVKDGYELIEDYPQLNYLSTDTLSQLKLWFINTIENINTWFSLHNKQKLEFIKVIKNLSNKLNEIVLYYNDFTKPIYDDNISHKVTDIDLLINWRTACDVYLLKLMNEYTSNNSIRAEVKLKGKKVNSNIKSINKLLDNVELTENQYLVIKNEYLPKLERIYSKKKKFKCLYTFINCFLQLSSVILPAVITFKDTQKIENQQVKNILDYSSISLAIFVGVLTNFTSFFKVNQKFSMYTQYSNKFRQELRRFLSGSEKYKGDKEPYLSFPKFAQAMEDHIDDMNNLEHELISKKTEDSKENEEEDTPNDFESLSGSVVSDEFDRKQLISNTKNLFTETSKINTLNNRISNLSRNLNSEKSRVISALKKKGRYD